MQGRQYFSSEFLLNFFFAEDRMVPDVESQTNICVCLMILAGLLVRSRLKTEPTLDSPNNLGVGYIISVSCLLSACKNVAF